MTAPELRKAEYEAIRGLLYDWTGIRLQNKQQLVIGRLSPRLRELGLSNFRDYVALVKSHGRSAKEAETFINQLTTNKTAFFRESHHFDYLREHLETVVAARAARTGDRRVRLWSAASSTGEEAYSIAMIAAQVTPPSAGWDVRILATDIDTAVLATARSGEYDAERLDGVPAALRARFFVSSGAGRVRVQPELTRLVTFEHLNRVGDPFNVREEFDIIFCRNVIIYFDQPTQKVVLARLSQRLNGEGRLFLGHSETLVGFELERVSEQIGVYRQRRELAGASPARPGLRPPALPPVRPTLKAAAEPALRSPRARASVTRTPASADGSALPHRRIILGEFHVATSPSVVSTLLGSCVSACLFDTERGVGGMNHFMLPNSSGSAADPANFGVHAMELLINALMGHGAQRKNLRAKVFGAGAVTQALPPTVGESNAAFVRAFLRKEGIPVLVERLGGVRPREVFLRTDSGEVLLRTITAQQAKVVAQRELGAWAKPLPAPTDFTADEALF